MRGIQSGYARRQRGNAASGSPKRSGLPRRVYATELIAPGPRRISDLHCRKNGRLYRLRALQPTGKYEPAFEVLRVDYLDAKRGRPVGRYRTRGEASKAVANLSYQEDDL